MAADVRGHRAPTGGLDLWRHVEELRRALLWAVLGWTAGTLVAWNWWDVLWRVLVRPLASMEHPPRIVALSPMAAVNVSVQVALVAGSLVAAPWILWLVWRFVAPALLPKERGVAVWALLWTTLLFAAGVVVGYCTILPMTMRWLASYGGDQFESMWGVEEYTGMCVKMLAGFGAMFEFPLVAWILSSLGVVDWKTLLRWSRGAIVAVFVVAAVLTPPDPVSQTILALPMMALWFAGVGVAWFARPRQGRG